jgi:hypothetical protein
MTDFYWDGCCNTGREDFGSHTVCAVLTSAFICAGFHGSSEGMLPRADAGSTPANPRSDTIANAVTASLKDIPNVSRNTLTSAADPIWAIFLLCRDHFCADAASPERLTRAEQSRRPRLQPLLTLVATCRM